MTVILLGRIGDPSLLPSEPRITAVTLAELSAGPLVASDEPERAARQAHLQQAEADFEPSPFDAEAPRSYGRVAASLRRAGQKVAARSYDAMTAAIAISVDLPSIPSTPLTSTALTGLICAPYLILTKLLGPEVPEDRASEEIRGVM